MPANALLGGITLGPDGKGNQAIWFTDAGNDELGMVTLTSNPANDTITETTTLPTSGLVGISGFQSQITSGPDGKLYFTEPTAIGIYDPTAKSWSEVPLPLLDGQQPEPFGIAIGPGQKSAWLTEAVPASGGDFQSAAIGVIDLAAKTLTVTNIPIATPSGGKTPDPTGITAGADGNVWFADTANGSIGEVTVTANPVSDPITETPVPTSSTSFNPLPQGITVGPDSNVWFSDYHNAIGVVDRLAIAVQPPASVTTGAGFNLKVNVETAGNALDATYNGNVTVALATNPGSSTLGGTLTVQAVSGVATFSGLTLNNAGTGYTFTVSADGVSSATTGGINVTAPAPQATQLQVYYQPTTPVPAGSPFSLVIHALTSRNALASSYSGTVNLTLATCPPGASLGGTTTVTASGGIASFSGLTLNLPGSYVIRGHRQRAEQRQHDRHHRAEHRRRKSRVRPWCPRRRPTQDSQADRQARAHRLPVHLQYRNELVHHQHRTTTRCRSTFQPRAGGKTVSQLITRRSLASR